MMCPSYRATGDDEQHLTRGRANTSRLALSGQIGPYALTSEDMRETMALCIWCKGGERECPTCCGMAGSFGYEAEHYEISLKIGELGVLPTIRAASADTLLAANGTSCRHQIADGAGREAHHLVRILDEASAGA
jgi:Fe-S oxidoreductase